MELGVYTFGEVMRDARTGELPSPSQRAREIVEEIALADEVGLDVYGLGEHHREDFVASAPAVLLAAGAERTSKIKLTSAVTVLSSEDPVRVFQQFALLDLISGGRAEIMAGRGAFTESFPLFGYDLEDYDALFEEKLRLLADIRDHEIVDWSGRFRAPLDEQGVYPRPEQGELPIWVGVGGTPSSVIRAADLGLPVALGIIGGDTRRFAPLADLYRAAAARSGVPANRARVSINSHGYVTDTAEKAVEDTYPMWADALQRFTGASKAQVPSKEYYASELAINGALIAGSPEQVAEKIVFQHGLFQHDRFLMQISVGRMPHRDVLRSIELLGTQVAPLVKAALPATGEQVAA